jgi:hypothetical protein
MSGHLIKFFIFSKNIYIFSKKKKTTLGHRGGGRNHPKWVPGWLKGVPETTPKPPLGVVWATPKPLRLLLGLLSLFVSFDGKEN